ncbi:MAG TPA: M15 family metallopeptidase [Polyangiaceae bacterium]|nr:M15 family metallopeptidase [Polyangiaceae bacterium]
MAAVFCFTVVCFPAGAFALSVEQAVSSGCSTNQVEGLSLQIIAQGNCIVPGAYAELPARPNTNFGGAVLPYLEQPARDALLAAIDAHPDTAMQVNSMLRTVAQQYLLYRWYQLGDCGIGLAATPGNSNHETGLAIDIQQYSTWRSLLEAQDFRWYGSGDAVHFDYMGPGSVDHRGVDVLAFQQLWNRNHPDDTIVEDGEYGPETQARLQQSPAEGFSMGAECATETGSVVLDARLIDAADTFDDGPSEGVVDLFVGQTYALEIELTNETEADVAGAVALALPEPLVSETTLDLGVVPAGESRKASLDLRAEGYSVDELDPLVIVASAGDASAELEADVYSLRRWEWDGGRLEGWSGSVSESALAFELATTSPALELPVEDLSGLTLRMATSAAATIVFVVGEDEVRHDLAIPADGEMHEVILDSSELALSAGVIDTISVSATSAELDYLRLEAPDPGAEPEAQGCACQTGPSRTNFAWLIAFLALLRRRK